MLRLAGREAQGVLLGLVGRADIAQIARTVAEASGGAERDLVLRLGVLPTADADLARAHCRRSIAAYLNVPAYASMHEWLGRGELLAPLARAWAAGDRKGALAAIPDALVDSLFVHGEAGACREQIEGFREAGVTTPVVSIMPFGGDPAALRSALRELAPR
jgi:alkanesulfonate monooxygenase SsuD/methylene tetrahydromethanopterin reductase-like flavin-dependent oxidoreductase (luciferase family)